MNLTGFRVNRAKTGLLLFITFAVLLGSKPAKAQFFFGKNKVQYTEFDWHVMSTEHFRIYFYPEEKELARTAAAVAEEYYKHLARKFNLELFSKVPLIIYSSPRYFAQTNVISGLLPESVAGFTEFLKGRVVLPFNGSYADFKHVIQHELVHVFQIKKVAEASNRQSLLDLAYPPLWFTEGLAETWSEEWDTEADMIVKDMVLTERLPSISQLWRVRGSYFMYKLGQSITSFIDSAYGPEKLTMIYENWPKGKRFDKIVTITLGESLNEVSRKWQYSLKKKYYPEIDSLGLPQMESTKLTSGGISLKGVPINWDDGKGTSEWVVFMANRMGYTGIYMKPRRRGGDKVVILIKGERSSKFESLHLLRSGIDANDSGMVTFSSKSKEQDVLYLYDLNSRKIVKRFDFDGMVGITSPRFSSDGSKIVFSGVKRSGYSDLYVVDVENSEYRQLTDDLYNDVDPVFSLDDGAVIFSSDRGLYGMEGGMNLFEFSISESQINQLTYGNYRDMTPDPSSQGIFFSSNRTGSYNLFLLDTVNEITKQSAYATGAFDPRVTPDGSRLVYTGFQAMGYQVYEMELLENPAPVLHKIAPGIAAWMPKRIDSKISRTSIKYDTDYSFDIAQSTIGYDPVFGSIGGVQGLVTDMLGNHAYYFLVSNTAQTKDQFLESINLGVTYINRKKRLNWGVGIFHLYNEYFNDVDQFFFERQAGALALFSYPVSKFSRFDLTTFARYDKKERRFGLDNIEAFLVTNQLGWVYDNSLWDISGPIEGRRYNLSLGLTTDANNQRNYNRYIWSDVRHYFRTGKYSAFANRLFYFSSTGIEPQRMYFGGTWNFRGFDRRAFYTRNVLFASNELRFPLVNNLLIGLPIGDLGFQAIRGALFFDVGSAWEDEFDQFLGSFGAGFRVSLGYLVLLRFDFARTTDFETISPNTDFDFFFGWNF